jgi:16S rRNA A1518/A1519 N6-dimethyltransferase RsmA/KsgA/DIM1 with predicted DNA glycosylase/AP lyase activity
MKRRRLGQHYLTDPEAVRTIVRYAQIKPFERVLEIGTGKGALTRELAGVGRTLVGYEIDPENFAATEGAVLGTGSRILLADAFEHRPEFDVLVSSLPYSESARFTQWLSGARFDRAVVVLQEDFVSKLTAPPGDRDYRGISALAQIAFDIKQLARVGRSSFSPPPRVDSVIVLFTPRRVVQRAEVLTVMRLFSLRRRRVGSALESLGMSGKEDYGLRRVFSLLPEEVHDLCRPRRAQ